MCDLRNNSSHFICLVNRLFDGLFISYCLLWIIIHVFRRLAFPIPLLNSWLTDFLFVPVVAHAAIVFSRHFVVRNKNYIYPLSWLLAIALYSAIAFEIVAPLFSSRATADLWDGVAYLLGGLFYYYVHQQKDFTFLLRDGK
jgi:hypothetical protein